MSQNPNIRSLRDGSIVTYDGKQYRKEGSKLIPHDTPRRDLAGSPPTDTGVSSRTRGSVTNYENRGHGGINPRYASNEGSRLPSSNDQTLPRPSKARGEERQESFTRTGSRLDEVTSSATESRHRGMSTSYPGSRPAFTIDPSVTHSMDRGVQMEGQFQDTSFDDSAESFPSQRPPRGQHPPIPEDIAIDDQNPQFLSRKRDVPQSGIAPRHSNSAFLPNDPFPAAPPDPDVSTDASAIVFLKLRGISRAFASLPYNDFENRASVLARNPELLDARLDIYLNEAVHQILEHNVSTASKCMQSLVVLNLCKGYKLEDLERVVLAMMQNGTKLNQKYQKQYEDVLASAEEIAREKASEKASNRGSARPGARSDLPALGTDTGKREHMQDTRRRDDSNTNPVNPAPRESGRNSRHRQSSYEQEYSEKEDLGMKNLTIGKSSKGQRGIPPDIFEGMTSAGLDPVRTDRNLIKIEPDEFPEKSMKTLSNKYQVPDNGAKFFITGKVFGVLWHESAGQPRSSKSQKKIAKTTEGEKAGLKDKYDSNLTIGPYGEKIYSHIRRMVVIRERNGYCWCIGINSYNGLGLKKPGLKKEERDAHTIIYDNRKKPMLLEEEPEIFRDPIPVEMKPGETLNIASRLHYGKPYVIEWNTRVMDVGTVEASWMPILLTDARAELLPP